MSDTRWSCMCLWQMTAVSSSETGLVMLRVLDDPFCPHHHPEEQGES